MTIGAKKNQEMGFDNAKLMGMTEPLMVRVEKIKGVQRQSFEIPGLDGAPPNCGYTRDAIMKLETWLVTEWAGGGLYRLAVTDANGVTMTWETSYPPSQFPEKTPPPLQQAATVQPISSSAPMPNGQMPQQPQQQQRPFTGQPIGQSGSSLYPGYVYQTPSAQQQPANGQQAQQPQQQVPQSYFPQQGFGYGNFGVGGRGYDYDDRGERDRTRALETQLTEARQQQMMRDAAAERDKVEQRYERMLAELRQEQERLREQQKAEQRDNTIAQQIASVQTQAQQQILEQQRQFQAMFEKLSAKPDNGDSDLRRELEREREERRRSEERMERQRETEKTERRMEQLQQQMMLSQQDKPNAVLDVMRETMRAQAEAQKEIARMAQEDRVRAQTIPFEMAKLMREASSAPEQMMATLSRSFGGILDTYDRVVQTIAQVQQGGQASPVMGMLQDGVNRATELAQQYMNNKSQVQMQEARARAVQANAQAEVARAQASVYQQPGQPLGGAPTPAPQAQAVPQAPVNGTAKKKAKTDPNLGVPETQAQGTAKKKPNASDVPTPPPPAANPEELRIFSVAYDDIMLVRQGIMAGTLVPEQVVEKFAKAAQQYFIGRQTNAIPEVPVFAMFESGAFADFVDRVLGSKVPKDYRDRCTELLFHVFDADAGGEDEEEADDGTPEDQAAPQN